MNAPFQILPPLSSDDYEALKADIAERGVMVPVEYDEDGNVIDGHHRVRACDELGIQEWPRITRSYPDEAAKRTQARKLNIARRHLGTAEKRALIEQELTEDAARSNRQIAAELGVSHHTVADVRAEAEAGGQIAHHETRVGRDGVEQPSTKSTRPPASQTSELWQADQERQEARRETARAAGESAAEGYLDSDQPTVAGLRAAFSTLEERQAYIDKNVCGRCNRDELIYVPDGYVWRNKQVGFVEIAA